MSRFALLKQKDGEVCDSKKDDPNWRRLSRFLIGALKGKQKRRQTSGVGEDTMESDEESVEASSSNEDEYSRKKRQEAEIRLRMLDEADTLSECSSVTYSFCNQTPDLMRSPRDKESEDGNVISNLSSRVDRCSESNSVTYSNSFVESLEEDVGYQCQAIDEEGQINDIVVNETLTLQPLDNALDEKVASGGTDVGVLAEQDDSQKPCVLAIVREENQVESLCLNTPNTTTSVVSDDNKGDEDDVSNRDKRTLSVMENSGEVGGTVNDSCDDKKLEIETDANEVDNNEVVTGENFGSFFTTKIEEEEDEFEHIPIIADDCDIPSNEDYPVVEESHDDTMLNILLVHESNKPSVSDSCQADFKCSPHVENDRSAVKEVLFEERNQFREPINVDIFKPYNEKCKEKLFESILYFDSVNLLQNVSCNKGSSSDESVADGKQPRAMNSTKRRQSLLGQTVNRPLQNCIDKGRLVAHIKEKMDRARTFIEKLASEAAYKKAVRNFAEAVDVLLVDSPLQEKRIDEKVYSADDISLRQKLNPTRLDILRTPVPRRRKPLLNLDGEPSNQSSSRSEDETRESFPHALNKRSQTFTVSQNSYDEEDDATSAINDKTWSVHRSDSALQTHPTVAGINTEASIDCKEYQTPLDPRKDERMSNKHTPNNVCISTRESGVHNSGTPAVISPLSKVCEKTAENNDNDVVNSSETTDKQNEKTYQIAIHRGEDYDLLNDEDIAFSSSEDETLDFVASMIGNVDDYIYLEEEDFFDSGIQPDKQTHENYTQKKGRNSTIDCAGSNIPVSADIPPLDFPLEQNVSLTNIASVDTTTNLEVDDKVSKLSVQNLGEENEHKRLGMSPSNFPINMSSKWCNTVAALGGNEEENMSTPTGMNMTPSLINITHIDLKLSGYELKIDSSKQNQSSHPDVVSQEHQRVSVQRNEMSRNEASDTTVLNESESFMSSTSGEYSLLPGPDKIQTTWSELLSNPYGKDESWSPSTFRRQENQNVDNPNSKFPLSELLVREKPATDEETIDLDKPEIFQRVGDESLPFVTRPALGQANQPTLGRIIEDQKTEAMSDNNYVLDLLLTTSECLRQLRAKMAFFEDLEKALTNSDNTLSVSQIPEIVYQDDDLLGTSSRKYDNSYEYLSKSEAELKRSLNATIGDISKRGNKDVISKSDNTIEVISKGDNTDEIVSKGENKIKVISRGDNTDKIISKGDNTNEVISRGDNTDEIVSKGDKTAGVVSRGDNTDANILKGDNTNEAISRGTNTALSISRGDNTVGVGVMSRGDNTVGVGVMSRGDNTVRVGVVSRGDNTVTKVVYESAVQVDCLFPDQTDQSTLTALGPETSGAGCDCPLEDEVISMMADIIQGGPSDTRRSKSSVEERVLNMSEESNMNVKQETLAELRKDILDNSESLKMFTTCIMNGLQEGFEDCVQGLASGLQEQISSVQTGLSKLQESRSDPCPCPHDKTTTVTKEDVDRLRLRLVDMKSQRDVEKMYHKITRESLRALDRDHDRLRQEMLLTSSRRRFDERRMSPHHQVLVNETAKSSFRDDNRSLFTSTPRKQKDSKDKETPQTSTSSKENPTSDSPK